MVETKPLADIDLLLKTAMLRRCEISDETFAQTGGTVALGPFAGMRLLRNNSWVGDGDIAPKLLGFYECELMGEVERIAQSSYDSIINIGCAEGFYAIGLATLMQSATVWAFDIDVQAQTICREAATLNGVAERVEVGGLCEPAILSKLLHKADKPYVVMDIEGAEKDLLCPERVPELGKTDFLVECHDFMDDTITPTLRARFAETHDLQLIHQGARNPNSIEGLHALNEVDRWLLVCEFRPVTMHWILGRAKQPA